jgi:hypothetical protein
MKNFAGQSPSFFMETFSLIPHDFTDREEMRGEWLEIRANAAIIREKMVGGAGLEPATSAL